MVGRRGAGVRHPGVRGDGVGREEDVLGDDKASDEVGGESGDHSRCQSAVGEHGGERESSGDERAGEGEAEAAGGDL